MVLTVDRAAELLLMPGWLPRNLGCDRRSESAGAGTATTGPRLGGAPTVGSAGGLACILQLLKKRRSPAPVALPARMTDNSEVQIGLVFEVQILEGGSPGDLLKQRAQTTLCRCRVGMQYAFSSS